MFDVFNDHGEIIIHLMKKYNTEHTIAFTICGRIAPIKVIATKDKPVNCVKCERIEDEGLYNGHR